MLIFSLTALQSTDKCNYIEYEENYLHINAERQLSKFTSALV